mmetsp:Transcript_3055/g.7169  ORF Transcript_3055/g.7169 Transcript_3055/m.7169 type:complete len:411 (+) Transcript_3055:563-1795(+)
MVVAACGRLSVRPGVAMVPEHVRHRGTVASLRQLVGRFARPCAQVDGGPEGEELLDGANMALKHSVVQRGEPAAVEQCECLAGGGPPAKEPHRLVAALHGCVVESRPTIVVELHHRGSCIDQDLDNVVVPGLDREVQRGLAACVARADRARLGLDEVLGRLPPAVRRCQMERHLPCARRLGRRSPAAKQVQHHGSVAARSCVVERAPPLKVGLVGVQPCAEELLDHHPTSPEPRRTRRVQRGPPVFVCGADVGAPGDEELEDAVLPALRGTVQRRLPAVVGGVDPRVVQAVAQQLLDDLAAAYAEGRRSKVQGAGPVLCERLHVGTGVDEPQHAADARVRRRDVQRGHPAPRHGVYDEVRRAVGSAEQQPDGLRAVRVVACAVERSLADIVAGDRVRAMLQEDHADFKRP